MIFLFTVYLHGSVFYDVMDFHVEIVLPDLFYFFLYSCIITSTLQVTSGRT